MPAGQDEGEEKLVHETENKSNETAHFKACDFRGKFSASTAKGLIHNSHFKSASYFFSFKTKRGKIRNKRKRPYYY